MPLSPAPAPRPHSPSAGSSLAPAPGWVCPGLGFGLPGCCRQRDFSRAASTPPAPAAPGAREGPRAGPGQVLGHRDHLLVVPVRQKTHTAFLRAGERAKAVLEKTVLPGQSG